MKYFLQLGILVFVLLCLSACTASPLSATSEGRIMQGSLEPLFHHEIRADKLVLSVLSTGCTRAEDFVVDVQTVDEVCQLAVYRVKPDRCRKAPEPKQVLLDFDVKAACASKRIEVVNPKRGSISSVSR